MAGWVTQIIADTGIVDLIQIITDGMFHKLSQSKIRPVIRLYIDMFTATGSNCKQLHGGFWMYQLAFGEHVSNSFII